MGSVNYKSSWESLHHVYTSLDSVQILYNETTTNTPNMTWQQVMGRQGRHTTCYMVLNKAEVGTLIQFRRVTNIYRRDQHHIVVDSSVQDLLGAAAYDTSMGYIDYHNNEVDKDEMYIIQFEVDYSNLLDAVYNKAVNIYQRGYSSISWQVLSEYTLVDLESYNLQGLGRRLAALQGADMGSRLHVEATESAEGDGVPTAS